MENFIYSLNVTLPVFLLMVIGWFLKHIKILDDGFISTCNKFNFKVTIPFLLIRNIADTDIREVFDGTFVCFCMAATTICFWSIWGLSRKLIKDKNIIGAFVQASFRGGATIFGVAFMDRLFGQSAIGPLMVAVTAPLYNIYAVLLMSFEGKDQENENRKEKIWEAIKNIIKNPIILGILVGMILSLSRIQLPVILDETVTSLAQLATPLALITLGAGFQGKKALNKIQPTILSAVIKLILQGAVFLPIAIYFGFTGEKLAAIMIMLTAPTAPISYIMAKNMKQDSVLAASTIVATTFLSAFTMTGWVYLLKTLNLL